MSAILCAQNWLGEEIRIDWRDLRTAHRQCRSVLRRLAADRMLLTALVGRLEADPGLFADADHHPVMDRLTLWHDADRGVYLRLHASAGANELIPHDHKYSFSSYILSGSYTHVWRRRTPEVISGEFTSGQVPLGLVTHEKTGSCYTLGYSLVHQTMMAANTITLFMRGPKEQGRSFAALDLLGRQNLGDGSGDPGSVVKKHTDGSRALRTDEYRRLRGRMIGAGLLEPVAVRLAE